VLSLGCGVGVQHLTENFGDKIFLHALDTKFMGATREPGIWVERCAGCGDCILDITAGICPVARCSKSIFNGPCRGSQDGKCEIDENIECAWQLIFDRVERLGKEELLERIIGLKDWSTARFFPLRWSFKLKLLLVSFLMRAEFRFLDLVALRLLLRLFAGGL